MCRCRFGFGRCSAALCLLLLLPLLIAAKPPDLLVGLRVLCKDFVWNQGAEQSPEKHRDLASEPDPGALLLVPVEQAQRLTLAFRLDKEGRRLLRMEVDLGHGPAALPALRSPQEKAVPLPPVTPGW